MFGSNTQTLYEGTLKIDSLTIIDMRVVTLSYDLITVHAFFLGRSSIDTDTFCTIKIVAPEH